VVFRVSGKARSAAEPNEAELVRNRGRRLEMGAGFTELSNTSMSAMEFVDIDTGVSAMSMSICIFLLVECADEEANVKDDDDDDDDDDERGDTPCIKLLELLSSCIGSVPEFSL